MNRHLTVVRGREQTCRKLLWCDQEPGHGGVCSCEVGSRLLRRPNGDTIDFSIRIREGGDGRQLTELQLGGELVHLDWNERNWVQRQLDKSTRHTRD